MTASAEMASPARQPGGFDPLRSTWRLLTNVKFAMVLVALAALFGMAGVLIPQMPAEMQGNPAAQSAWLELQRGDFGGLTQPMDRLGLFNVFRSWWFNGLWLLIIASVTVCTVSRIRPTARSVHRPQKVVPDTYYETAHHRAEFEQPGGVQALEALLRQRHYRVERIASDDGTVQLFAERFGWSQYGTFISHLALIMLLIGGLLTVTAGFGRTLALAETSPGVPVFDSPGADQIFVRMVDAHEGRDAGGNIVEYRSTLEIRRGDEIVTCEATVNGPCRAFGYKFHQAAFFNDLARMRIEGPDGRVLYSDVLDFNAAVAAVPRVRVEDSAGTVLFERSLPQYETDPGASDGREDDFALSVVAFTDPDGKQHLWAAAWRVIDGEMVLLLTGDHGEPQVLTPGAAAEYTGGLRGRFVAVAGMPTIRLEDMPGTTAEGGAVVQLAQDEEGVAQLIVAGVGETPLAFAPGQTRTTAEGYRFTFEERVDGAGIDIRRDPGSRFIWIAVSMAMVGLAITFYVPRRRLWAKVEGQRTRLAGIAERSTRFGRELRLMGAELGAKDALRPDDVEERY